MGIKVNVSGSSIKGNVRILNEARICGNIGEITVDIDNSEIAKEITILNNAQIAEMERDIRSRMLTMDKNSKEYIQLKKLLCLSDSEERKKKLIHHVCSFTQGVAASVVAGFITK